MQDLESAYQRSKALHDVWVAAWKRDACELELIAARDAFLREDDAFYAMRRDYRP